MSSFVMSLGGGGSGISSSSVSEDDDDELNAFVGEYSGDELLLDVGGDGVLFGGS